MNISQGNCVCLDISSGRAKNSNHPAFYKYSVTKNWQEQLKGVADMISRWLNQMYTVWIRFLKQICSFYLLNILIGEMDILSSLSWIDRNKPYKKAVHTYHKHGACRKQSAAIASHYFTQSAICDDFKTNPSSKEEIAPFIPKQNAKFRLWYSFIHSISNTCYHRSITMVIPSTNIQSNETFSGSSPCVVDVPWNSKLQTVLGMWL